METVANFALFIRFALGTLSDFIPPMRRSFFIFLLSALLVFGIYRYWKVTSGPADHPGMPASYTPATAPKIDLKDVQVLAALDAEYSRLVEAVVPSVVSITSSGTVLVPQGAGPFDYFFPNRRPRTAIEQQKSSLGSGVIVSREGHILTNHHVIAGMDRIEVQFTDGRREPAQLLGSDEITDIAVLKINAGDLEPLAFGDSDALRVGQIVFAIGNPFGLQETVTQGIVSAKGRRAMADSGAEFIQTDVAVNQGNSGGPLINLRGEIVGINSAIFSRSNDGGWLGISFAIPANTARRTLESFLKNGRVIRGYLGVMMSDLTPQGARSLGLSDTHGVLIGGVVAGSPAEAAGLQVGDLVRTFNGKTVADALAMRSRLAEADVDAEVTLEILRQGQPLKITAKIAEVPENPSPQLSPSRPLTPRATAPQTAAGPHPLTAIDVSEIPPAVRRTLPPNVDGIMITQIPPGSPLAQKLRAGDIIQQLGERPVQSAAAFERAVTALGPRDKAVLLITRGNTRQFIVTP